VRAEGLPQSTVRGLMKNIMKLEKKSIVANNSRKQMHYTDTSDFNFKHRLMYYSLSFFTSKYPHGLLPKGVNLTLLSFFMA